MKSAAFGINNAGIIVGYYQASAGEELRGFVRQGKAYDILEVPSSKNTVANGLNDEISWEITAMAVAPDGFVYSRIPASSPLIIPALWRPERWESTWPAWWVGWYRDAAGQFPRVPG